MTHLELYNLYTAALSLQAQSQQILESFNEAFPYAPSTPLHPLPNAHVYEWKLYEHAMIWWGIEMDAYLRSLDESDSVRDNHTEMEQTGMATGMEPTSMIRFESTATVASGGSSNNIGTVPLKRNQVISQPTPKEASMIDVFQLWDAATHSPSILSPDQSSLLPSDANSDSNRNLANHSSTRDDKCVNASMTAQESPTHSSSHPTPHDVNHLSLEDDAHLDFHAVGSAAFQSLAPKTAQPSDKRKRRTSESEEHRRIPPPPGAMLVHRNNARVVSSLGQNNTRTKLSSRPQGAMQQMQMPYQHQPQHAPVLQTQCQGAPVLTQFQGLPNALGRYPSLYPSQVFTINQVLTPYHAVQYQGSLGFQTSGHLVGVNVNIPRVDHDYNTIAIGTSIINMPYNANMPQCQSVFLPLAQPINSFRFLRPAHLLTHQAMPATVPPGLMNFQYPFPARNSVQQVKRARAHVVPILNSTRPIAIASGSVTQQFLPRNNSLPKEKDKSCEESVHKASLSYEIDHGLIWHMYDGASKTFQYVSSASFS